MKVTQLLFSTAKLPYILPCEIGLELQATVLRLLGHMCHWCSAGLQREKAVR